MQNKMEKIEGNIRKGLRDGAKEPLGHRGQGTRKAKDIHDTE